MAYDEIRVVGLALALGVSMGCSSAIEADADTATRSDEARVRGELARLGLQPATLDIDDDRDLVRLGDLIFDRTRLLAGDYGNDSNVDQDAIVPKAYLTNGNLVSQDNIGNIKVVYHDLPAFIETGVYNALLYWNNTNSAISMAPQNTGVVLNVYTLADPLNPFPCGGGNQLACALAPVDGRPGDVYVKIDPGALDNPGSCDWNDNLLQLAMLHEFGHALGFTHPEDAGALHVNDTQMGTTYETVMHAATPGTHDGVRTCTAEYYILQGDDIRAAQLLYPR